MRVGLIATPWIPVPPCGYGGTEAVLDNLARGLDRAGHDVTLFTVGESTCDVKRSWLFPSCMTPMNDPEIERQHIEAAYQTLLETGVDVIHDHTIAGPLFASRTGTRLAPVVTTTHNTFTASSRQLYQRIARRVPVLAISRTQRSRAGMVPIEAVIPHGIDTSRYVPGPGGGGYLAFVGRMSADKGVHRAVEIAGRAGIPLVIMAKMRDDQERQYFRDVVEPLLGPDTEVLFEPDEAHRIDIVGRAEALLNPIAWPEPFGLVMAESLACGTPVLTCPVGAATEIVRHGVTGFLHQDVADLVRAVKSVGDIDRAQCRADAEAHFSMRRMVADHVSIYEDLIRRAATPASPRMAGTRPAGVHPARARSASGVRVG